MANTKASSLKVPKGYNAMKSGTSIKISQSQAADFSMCQRKWLYRINGLSNPSSNKTDFGNIFHAFLERCYCFCIDAMRTLEEIQLMIPKWIKEIEEENTSLDAQSLEWEIAVAEVVFRHYLKRYPHDFVDKNFILAEGFAEKEMKTGVSAYCKLDAAYRDKEKKIWIMETKTWGRVQDEDKLDYHLSMNHQCLWEAVCLSKELKKTVSGCLINICRKPQLKRGDSIQQYCERLDKDIAERPEFYFIRREVAFTPAKIRAYEKEFMLTIVHGIDGLICSKHKPMMNPCACQTSYGYCDYLEACAKNDISLLVKRSKNS